MILEMRKILKATGKGRSFLLLLLLRSPVDAAFTVINAIFLQRAFNAVSKTDNAALTSACLFFGVATLCVFLYNGTVWSIYAPFTVRMESRLRVKLFDRISSFSYERIEATSQGEWLTRLNTDVEMPFNQPIHLPHAACAIVNISVSAVILWLMNPAIFGWVTLFVIPHIAVSQIFIARVMPKWSKKSLEAKGKNTGEFAAIITCADTAALYAGQDYLMRRFEQSSRDLLRANMKLRTRNAVSAAFLPLFGLGGYLALLIVSGGWIAQGKLTFGGLTAAFQYRGGVLAGSMMLINCLINIGASMAGIRRLNQTLNDETERPIWKKD